MTIRRAVSIIVGLCVLALIWLVWPTDAHGLNDRPTQQFLKAAKQYWKAPLSCKLTVDLVDDVLRDDRYAAADMPGCHIIIERKDYKPYDNPVAWCDIMVHEYGHSLGHDHVSDPTNIMYETAAAVVKPCKPKLKCVKVHGSRRCARYVAGIRERRPHLVPVKLLKNGNFNSSG